MRTNNETFSRVRTLHGYRGSGVERSAQRYKAADRGTSQTGCAKPEPQRTEAETKNCYAFRFGPRGKRSLVDRLFFFHLAGDFGPRQALSDDLTNGQIKAVTVSHIPPIIEAERLFINIAKQVKRFHGNIGAVDPTLQKTPEVLKAVRMHVLANVFNGVVNYWCVYSSESPSWDFSASV